MNEETRLQKLEETITHQDTQIADLSEMLIVQGKEIAALAKELKRLKSKIELYAAETGEDGMGKAQSPTEFAAQNKPPHY